MDTKRLSEIRKRHAAATKGPWVVDGGDIDPPESEVIPYTDGSRPGVATAWPTQSATIGLTTRHLRSGTREANAAFIAHSWQDVRDLLDALSVAQGDEAALRDAVRVLEEALVTAEARLEEMGYKQTAKVCDTALREARALTKKRTPAGSPPSP
jgi:hypothetical protein